MDYSRFSKSGLNSVLLPERLTKSVLHLRPPPHGRCLQKKILPALLTAGNYTKFLLYYICFFQKPQEFFYFWGMLLTGDDMKRRCIVILFVFIWLSIAMGGRLAYIALGERYVATAESQSQYTLTVDLPRGTIYDRNGESITNRQVLYKTAVTSTPQVISQLHRFFTGETKEMLLELVAQRKPFVVETRQPFSAQGATGFTCRDSKPFYQPAVHIVGYLDGAGEAGVSGLQKYCDEILKCSTKSTVTYYCDATGGALAGLDVQYTHKTEEYEKGVLTTLDLQVQTAAEQAFPPNGKGAVIIQKCGSGELLAAVSAPDFSPQDIAAALQSADSPLLNRSTTAYNVGSVFKLCVVAAALEKGIDVNHTYTCKGSISCGVDFHCHKKEGHGTLNMTQALAQSCNPYFIDLAQKIGGEALYDMAVKLGFGTAPICPGLVSDSGSLPVKKELLRSPAEIGNFAIGQGALLATPLQINAMTNAIASGGILFDPYLIMGVRNQNGLLQNEKASAGRRVMSRQTADTICRMMEQVMTKGTGSKGAVKDVTSGGKTATAQTGIVDEKGNRVTQAWFTGFFPAENPAYVVTVLVEGGASGGSDAAPVFKKICEALG